MWSVGHLDAIWNQIRVHRYIFVNLYNVKLHEYFNCLWVVTYMRMDEQANMTKEILAFFVIFRYERVQKY
jgi:hypothetical protein